MKWNQNIFLSRVRLIHTTATVCVSVSENKQILLRFTFSHNYVSQDDVLPFFIITGYLSTSQSLWGFIFTVNYILLLTQEYWTYRMVTSMKNWTEGYILYKSSVLFSWIPAQFRFLTSICTYEPKAKYECWCNWKDCVQHYPTELLQHKFIKVH